MRFVDADLEFIKGSEFSNGRNFKVSSGDDPFTMDRFAYLEEKAKGKNILHLGFADHLPLIERKIKANKWLHKRLMDASKRCIGIDIDDEAIRFVKDKLNLPDILKMDIVNENPPETISNTHWEYMILGEILEHVDNPIMFLKAIHEKYKGLVDHLIVTVPNATILNNIYNIRKGIECINTDHRFWFTPFTLAKVGYKAGYKPEEFGYCQNWMPASYIRRILVKKYPMVRDSVVMVFSF